MHQFLAVLFAIGTVLLFLGTVQRARKPGAGQPKARKGGVTGHWLESRRLKLAHRLGLERDRERGAQRLAEQEARAEREREREQERQRERERWQQSGEDGPQPRRRGVPRTIRLHPEKPDAQPPAAPAGEAPGPRRASPPPSAPASPPPAPEPPRPPRPAAPPPQSPSAPAPAPASEGTTPVTSQAIAVTAVEDVLLGIDRAAATGIAGNVHAKRRALAELAAVLARCDSAILRMQRSMAEEGLYGPEITDPMTGPADQAASAARGLTEVDSVILGLLNLPTGELAGSGYKVPHHQELSETGGR